MNEPANVISRVDDLRKQIEYHNNLYYNHNTTEISDYEFDMLQKELRELEAAYPDLKTDDSPTQKIAGNADNNFKKVKHNIQMNSLQDVFDFDEIANFVSRVSKTVTDPVFVVEPKIDGLSVSLLYENGELKIGSTRGDGFVGEDVTENIRTIKSAPLKIPTNVPLIEVRGECYMSVKSFDELIEKQTLNGEPLAKNPRNAASGALRQKNPEITRERNLDIIIFNLQQAKNANDVTEHTKSLDWLNSLGFDTVPYYECHNLDEIKTAVDKIGKNRLLYPYNIDGAAIKINNLAQRELLGANSKTPNWAVAYKYPPEEKNTTLRAIELNIGRTGAITPVAIFDPVSLAGTIVSRATLCNQNFIQTKNINIGDVITVRKAGDIIPEIVCVSEKLTEDYYRLPDTCPDCGNKLVSHDASLVCENDNCPSKTARKFEYFVSKSAMDINSLGPSSIKALLDANLLKGFADIYYLSLDDLTNLFGKKKAENILKSIEKSKSNDLCRLINALGIKNVGLSAAKLLASKFGDIDALSNATVSDILAIEGFGETTAQSIVDTLARSNIRADIMLLQAADVNTKCLETKPTGSNLSDKTFVITGTLPSMSRDEAKALIIENGGKVSDSISKKTTYLLAGEKAGSKLEKAKALNITVISQQELLDMINGKDVN